MCRLARTLAILASLGGFCGVAFGVPESGLLKSAAQVHRLSSQAAGQHLPVQLQGIVTQTMPDWDGFALQDKTDAVFVTGDVVKTLALHAGDRVQVQGTTGPGNYAPMVFVSAIKVLGSGPLPAARPVDWQFLSSGACDNEYVSVTGVVRSAVSVDSPVWRWRATAIHIDVGGNLLWAYARESDTPKLEDLADDVVRISGTCVVFSNSRKRFESTALLLSDPAKQVEVLQPVSMRPEQVPLTSISHLFVYARGDRWQRRVRVRGTVTWVSGNRVAIEDGQDGLMLRTVGPAQVKVGQLVDAVGFPTAGPFAAELEDVLVVPIGSGTVKPLAVNAARLVGQFHSDRPNLPDSMLIRLEAVLVGVSRSQTGADLALQAGPVVFNARLSGAQRTNWVVGSKVAVTGVCMVRPDDLGAPTSFEVMLRSAADVQVLQKPDWLTRSFAVRTAVILLGLATVAVFTVILLTRRVGMQSGVIALQKKREEELGARMQQLVENANDLVYILGIDGRILHANFGAERLTGYSREEQQGLKMQDLLDDGERQLFAETIARHVRSSDGGDTAFEQSDWTFCRKDGTRLSVELNQRIVTGEDKQIRIELIGRDVTARKRAVLDNEERFRTLADNIPQLAWMADEKGDFVWFNQRWLEYTGASLQDLRAWGWTRWHHPEHVGRVMTRLRQCFTDGEAWEDAFPLRREDGQYRWFLGRATPIRDESGKVVRWFGTNTDISKQKQTETELQRSNDDLRQFAYIASHDLQEPIRNVIVFSQMLARTFANGDLTPKRSTYLNVVIGGAKRMEALLAGLLSYSQATATERAENAPVAAETCVREALESLKLSIEESGAVIEVGELPNVVASSLHLTQVFQNLIGNAIKYRREGVAPVIAVRARQQVDRWLFSVQDNGQGFDTQYASNLFGIFKRLHGQEIPGTGIGLAICKAIVERHGGTMWAEGKPGEGATFWFTLPVDAPVPA